MNSVQLLSDEELIRNVEGAAAPDFPPRHTSSRCSREIDARRLYLEQGYSSLFVHCTKRLRLSEHAAYGRIEAARVSRKFPAILHMLTEGSITLTTICLLSNHLTEENHEQLLEAARHKTRREVEGLVAALHPMPPVPSSVRRLTQPRALALSPAEMKIEASSASAVASPAPTSVSAKPTPARPPAPPIVRPLAPELYNGSVQHRAGDAPEATSAPGSPATLGPQCQPGCRDLRSCAVAVAQGNGAAEDRHG